MHHSTPQSPHCSTEAGFTFVELIVVLSIFAALAGIVLFRFADFNANVVRNTLAQDVALRIQEAQNDAVTGRLASSTLGGTNRPSYGVFFSTASPQEFTYFFDRPTGSTDTLALSVGNGLYDQGLALGEVPDVCDLADECVDIIEIAREEEIRSLCVYNDVVFTQPDPECEYADKEGVAVDQLHISFTRPFPGASIHDGQSNGPHDQARIIMESPGGQQVAISVWRTGQISVR